MICLTGDVHHMSMRNPDQRGLGFTEVQAAQKYAEIAGASNQKISFFITGKSFVEEWNRLEPICRAPNVEVGGHNYFAFQPRLFYALSKAFLGLSNGPRAFQKYETRRTLETIQKYTGHRIKSWRDHAYRRDRNTYALLEACGIGAVSDEIDYKNGQPARTGQRLLSVPINVPVDHDHICPRNHDKPLMDVQQWYGKVTEAVERHVSQGRIATLLVHPICMEQADQMQTFRRLIKFLAKFRSVFMSELIGSDMA